MYYPYFRGRQNELLCLREMLEDNKLSNKIIPVLEPVKCSSTFFATVKKFIECDRPIILIENPGVGKFDREYKEMEEGIEKEQEEEKRGKLERTLEGYKEILKNEHVFIAYLVNDKTINKVLKCSEELKGKIYLINKNRGDDNYYTEHGNELSVKASFIPKDEDFKDEVIGDTIILEDCYEKARRNVDYSIKPDEFFSKNHLIFKKRGYQGFSDYSIVGNGYEESGFAPLAIAIHIVYLGDKNELRIHHFVSDTNGDISDPARKFEEAMDKLVNWDRLEKVEKTKGLMGLINYYENGRFPGLGMIKKFSLMHHVELMGKYLEDTK